MSDFLRLIVGQFPQRLPPLVSHDRDRPFVLDSTLQPHFGVVPIESRVEMTPVQTAVLAVDMPEPVAGPPQPADVLGRNATNEFAPRLVAILRNFGITCLQRLTP